MVPERIANGTDPFKQMTGIVGSGPFRFLKDEYVIGSHAALVPFERYVPRDEPASFTSGGHRVLVDRVEWKMIPDAATAANALVDRRGGLAGNADARSAADAAARAERGDRPARRLGFHQPVAAQPRRSRRPTT